MKKNPKGLNKQPVALGNTRILTNYAQKSPPTLAGGMEIASPASFIIRPF